MNKLIKTEHAATCPVSNRRFPQRGSANEGIIHQSLLTQGWIIFLI